MADIRTTIFKTQDGREKIHYGTATLLSGATSGTIQVDLHRVDCFIMSHCDKYTVATTPVGGGKLVTVTFLNPGATEVVGWIAIGL